MPSVKKPLKVREVIEQLLQCDQEAVVIVRAFEDGAFAQEVIPSTVTNAKAMYWKGDCPVRSEYTPTVVIGEEH